MKLKPRSEFFLICCRITAKLMGDQNVIRERELLAIYAR